MNGKILFVVIMLSFAYGQSPSLKINHMDTTKTVKTQSDSFPFLPEGAIIHARKGDKIFVFLPKNMKIQGVWCRGHKFDWETGFYTNGKLALVWLPHDQDIQGVPCMKATFWTEISGKSAKVLFYDNGQLQRCKLAKDFTIEGHFFKKGDIVHFNRQGKPIIAK